MWLRCGTFHEGSKHLQTVARGSIWTQSTRINLIQLRVHLTWNTFQESCWCVPSVEMKRSTTSSRWVVQKRRGFHNKVRRSQTFHHIKDQRRAIESKGIIKLFPIAVTLSEAPDNASSSITKFFAAESLRWPDSSKLSRLQAIATRLLLQKAGTLFQAINPRESLGGDSIHSSDRLLRAEPKQAVKAVGSSINWRKKWKSLKVRKSFSRKANLIWKQHFPRRQSRLATYSQPELFIQYFPFLEAPSDGTFQTLSLLTECDNFRKHLSAIRIWVSRRSTRALITFRAQ